MALNIESQPLLNQQIARLVYLHGMSLGARFRQLRIRHKLSQERIGELCGVSKSMVSQWESDAVTPPTDRLLNLRKHLEFSFDWLLSDVHAADDLRPALQHLLRVAEPLPDYAVSKLSQEGVTYAELLARDVPHNGTDG